VNVPVPLENEHVTAAENIVDGLLVAVPEASVVKNPLPEIVPEVPDGPEIGVIVILGPVTVKVAVAKSLPGLAATVIV
jgi:hypothetical protein